MLVAFMLLVIALLLAVIGFFLHLGEDIGGSFLGAVGVPQGKTSYIYLGFYWAAFGCLVTAVYCGMSHLSVHVSIN